MQADYCGGICIGLESEIPLSNDEIVHEGFWEDCQWNIADLTM